MTKIKLKERRKGDFVSSPAGTLWHCNKISNIKSLLYYSPENANPVSLQDYYFIGIDRSCAIINLNEKKRMQAGHNFSSIGYEVYKVMATTENGDQKVGWIQFSVVLDLIPYEDKLKINTTR